MEQRPLRLGDVVDDYCPRERRITNHAIVAIVDNTIRQTRCTTCDSEHVYKEARVPKRRKADASLADAAAQLAPPRAAAASTTDMPSGPDEGAVELEPEPPELSEPARVAAPDASIEDQATNGSEAAVGSDEEPVPVTDSAEDAGPAHRRLIRATLPRIDGDAPARPIPEFTMHQRQTRGSHMFRQHGQPRHGGNGHGNGGGQGQGQGRGGVRHGRPGGAGHGGNGSGAGQHPRSGRGRPGRHRGHNKRSR